MSAPDPDDGTFPPLEPYTHGLLDVGDGNRVAWTTSGKPDGSTALLVHGGPGSGSSRFSRRFFDPARWRIVQFDQRGCGQSTPHASDPSTDMSVNTTHHLLADMERLRGHLGVDRWLLLGNSWGSTLGLAYAQRHPERVTGIVLVGVTTCRHAELEWLYGGVARFLPEQWERFRAAVPEDERGGDLTAAYARLMEHRDAAVRERAAAAWVAWEDAVIAHETQGNPTAYSDKVGARRLAFVRICTHYFSHRAWLEDGELLRNAHRLAGIPGVLIHGRLDLGGPLGIAWDLAQAWPDAELVVVDEAGHTGTPAMHRAIVDAIAGFA